jgi:hypothetical protein
VQSIAVINGMPSIWGDGALAVIEQSGLLEDMVEAYEEDDEQGLIAVCTMKRRDRATPIVTRFSTAMADHAGLTRSEGAWQSYPERMLRMRARSWTMRDGFADVLRGLHLREEVDDYDRTRAVRPTAVRRDGAPQGGQRPYPSARPRRTAGSAVARRPDIRLQPALEPNGGQDSDRPVPEQPVGPADRSYSLIDADGVVLEVRGPEALRAGFEQMLFDKHLSPAQVAGVWESNEPARQAIERLFGPQILAPAREHLGSIHEIRSPVREGQPRETKASPPTAASGNGQPEDNQPAEADRALVLEINPTWGVQKIFHRYRAALSALCDSPTGGKPSVVGFREVNLAVEQRLRAKLPSRMTEIDAIYTQVGLDP